MDSDVSLSGSYANMRLRYLLDSGDWTGEIAGWMLPKSAGAGARLDFAFARAIGEIALGRRDAARQALEELETVGRAVTIIKTTDPDPNLPRAARYSCWKSAPCWLNKKEISPARNA
jgi:hypothetical protein